MAETTINTTAFAIRSISMPTPEGEKANDQTDVATAAVANTHQVSRYASKSLPPKGGRLVVPVGS
jgi:hypothetical protein